MAHRRPVILLLVIFSVSMLGSVYIQPAKAVQSYSSTTGVTNEAVIEVQFPNQNTPLLITQNQSVLNSLQGQANYYFNASYGQLTINYKFFGPFPLPYSELTYGQDSGGQIDPNKIQLICDSLNAAEQGGVPLALYQHITIVHAGTGQESTHNSGDIYSSWIGFSSPCRDSNNLQIPTTRVIVVSEYSPVGTFCHEFGHDNGLPDIYDLTSGSTDDYIGPWSLMAAGNWLTTPGNPAGSSPGSLDSWSKTQLGWIKPVTVSNATANVTIGALELPNQSVYAVKIPLTPTSYYLLEARRSVGVDTAIPSEGVLVFLVNEGSLGSNCYISPCYVSGVLLVEPHPNPNLNTAPIQPGSSFADPQNRVFIKVLSQSGTGYRVQITSHMLFVTLLGPLQVSATQTAIYTVHVTDELGNTRSGIRVTLSLDGKVLRESTTDLVGNATFQVTYNWTDIGFHSLAIQTQAISYYIDGSQKTTLQVVLPTSAYPVLAAILIVPLGIVLLRRHKHSELPPPQQWSSIPAYSIPSNFCPQCGQPVAQGSSYCMFCGTRFS